MAGHTNASMSAAIKAKNDEFYTLLTDIEKEMRHYRKHFKGKTVLCNCDDPFESNFFKYFVLNFNRLGLKKLIATCYATSPIANQQLSLFDVVGGDGEREGAVHPRIRPAYEACGIRASGSQVRHLRRGVRVRADARRPYQAVEPRRAHDTR